MESLSLHRVKKLLAGANQTRVLVVGDVMLDQFIWGRVTRISPEAPVPVVEFERENSMPGGAANVARNLTALNVATELLGAIGDDEAGANLKRLLDTQKVGCSGLLKLPHRMTSVKTRIIAHQQQIVRMDRESKNSLDPKATRRLIAAIE